MEAATVTTRVRPVRHRRVLAFGRWLLDGSLNLYAALALIYLLAPIAIIILFSFNDPAGRFNFTWAGFTLDNWKDPFGVPGLQDALVTSIQIAALSTVIATALGTMMALALVRYQFRGRATTNFFIFLPLAAPEIVLGASLLSLFIASPQTSIGLAPFQLGFSTILIAHVMFNISFVVVTVRSRLIGFDRSLEEAAQDLGANGLQTFMRITLPLIAPGVLAAALLAFALSVDDFVITTFSSGSTITFPLFVWGGARVAIPPQINIIATMIFFVTVALMLLTVLQQRRAARMSAVRPEPRRLVMGTFEQLAALPLEIDSYELEPLEQEVSSDFTRATTVIGIGGGGQEGVGEDVTYDALDHVALQDAGPVQDLAGSWTLGSFTEHVAALDLFPAEPVREVSRLYRRWGFDSAALDLALRQAGISLARALGREPRPVTFVVSLRLGKPPTLEPVSKRLDRYPSLRFKLDPVTEWTDELIAELVRTGAVDSVDFKGFYVGTVVDQPPDPDLYGRVAEAFPDAWLEDPGLNDATLPVLERHKDRFTWDAPIHSIADIEALQYPPRMVNVKPSRFGGLRSLLDAYDYLAERGIGAYGGGQFELGPGRGQNQYLASLFHPDTPNDVAPTGFNLTDPPDGLPEPPLEPQISDTGFRWGE